MTTQLLMYLLPYFDVKVKQLFLVSQNPQTNLAKNFCKSICNFSSNPTHTQTK